MKSPQRRNRPTVIARGYDAMNLDRGARRSDGFQRSEFRIVRGALREFSSAMRSELSRNFGYLEIKAKYNSSNLEISR